MVDRERENAEWENRLASFAGELQGFVADLEFSAATQKRLVQAETQMREGQELLGRYAAFLAEVRQERLIAMWVQTANDLAQMLVSKHLVLPKETKATLIAALGAEPKMVNGWNGRDSIVGDLDEVDARVRGPVEPNPVGRPPSPEVAARRERVKEKLAQGMTQAAIAEEEGVAVHVIKNDKRWIHG